MSRILPSNDVNVLHDEVGFNTIFISGLKIDRLKYCACSFKNLFTENTVQEPTFERIIVVYRYSFQLLGAQYTLKYEYLWGRRTFLIHILFIVKGAIGALCTWIVSSSNSFLCFQDDSSKSNITSMSTKLWWLWNFLLNRKASKPHHILDPLGDRAIHIRHFQKIPMADMELVLVSLTMAIF